MSQLSQPSLSDEEFAKLRGVLPATVRQWRRRGKISGAALLPDGRIVLDEALRQLGQRLDPGRGPSRGSDPTLIGLRIEKERLVVEAMRRKAAVEDGSLMIVEDATRAWNAEIGALIAAIEGFVTSDLPGRLDLPAAQVVTVRSAWREFRRRYAAQKEAEAEALRAGGASPAPAVPVEPAAVEPPKAKRSRTHRKTRPPASGAKSREDAR